MESVGGRPGSSSHGGVDKLLEIGTAMAVLCGRNQVLLEEIRRDCLDKGTVERLGQVLMSNANLKAIIDSNNECVLRIRAQSPGSILHQGSSSQLQQQGNAYQGAYQSGSTSSPGFASTSHSNRRGFSNSSAPSMAPSSNAPDHVCHICQAILSSKFTLSQHLATHDSGPPRFMCDVCGRRYRHQRSVTDHKKQAHNQRHSLPGTATAPKQHRRSSQRS